MCDIECPTFTVGLYRGLTFCLGAVLFYINMKLFLTSKIWKEGQHFVAYNPELEVASQGKTFEVASQAKNFKAAKKCLKEPLIFLMKLPKKTGHLIKF